MSSLKKMNNMSYIEKQDAIKIRRVIIGFTLIQVICCLLIEKYVNDHYSEPEYFGGFLTVGKYIVFVGIVLLNFLICKYKKAIKAVAIFLYGIFATYILVGAYDCQKSAHFTDTERSYIIMLYVWLVSIILFILYLCINQTYNYE